MGGWKRWRAGLRVSGVWRCGGWERGGVCWGRADGERVWRVNDGTRGRRSCETIVGSSRRPWCASADRSTPLALSFGSRRPKVLLQSRAGRESLMPGARPRVPSALRGPIPSSTGAGRQAIAASGTRAVQRCRHSTLSRRPERPRDHRRHTDCLRRRENRPPPSATRARTRTPTTHSSAQRTKKKKPKEEKNKRKNNVSFA